MTDHVVGLYGRSVAARAHLHGADRVIARERKLVAENAALQRQLSKLDQEESRLQAELDMNNESDAELLDDVREMVLRVVHAKLYLDGLRQEEAALTASISGARQELHDAVATTIVREYERGVLEAAMVQRGHEAADAQERQLSARSASNKYAAIASVLKADVEFATREELHCQEHLQQQRDRLRLMSDVISDALAV